MHARVRRQIQRLTNTYVTLSLSDIAEQTKLSSAAEAEAYVLGMIKDGAIFAKIDQRDGMVSFLDDPEDYNTNEMVRTLDAKLQTVMDISRRLNTLNNNLLLDPGHARPSLPTLKLRVMNQICAQSYRAGNYNIFNDMNSPHPHPPFFSFAGYISQTIVLDDKPSKQGFVPLADREDMDLKRAMAESLSQRRFQ